MLHLPMPLPECEQTATVFISIVTFMHNPNVSIFLHTSTLIIISPKEGFLVSLFRDLPRIPHLWQVTSPVYPKSAAPRPSNPRPAPSSNTCRASAPWPWAKKAKAARQLPETSRWTWTSSMSFFSFFFSVLKHKNKSTSFFQGLFYVFLPDDFQMKVVLCWCFSAGTSNSILKNSLSCIYCMWNPTGWWSPLLGF